MNIGTYKSFIYLHNSVKSFICVNSVHYVSKNILHSLIAQTTDTTYHTSSSIFYLNPAKEVIIESCISSSVRPLVSGTIFATNRTVKKPMPEKMKNVPAVVQPTKSNV